MTRWVAAAVLAVAATSPALAAGLSDAPPGASACSGCHGSAVADGPPPIHGRPADEIVTALAEFRAGKRPATVMNRIAPGFTEAESRTIAAWISAQPAP